ncbi:MAG: hypothetical protein Q9192_003826 [Flavoplaca navasiana]
MAEPPTHHCTQSAPTEPDSALNDPDRWNQKYLAASARAIAQPLSGESPPTASHDQPDILRIIPLSSEARRAFDSVVRSKEAGTLHDNHAKYLQITGTAPLNAPTDASNQSGVTTDEDNQTRSAGRSVYEGYYSVRLSLIRVAPAPSWIIGKGSGKKFGPTRNVDILLAAPGSGLAASMHAIHAFLALHPQSGVWILRPSTKMTVEDESIEEAIALYRWKTHFNIGSLHYLIEFRERIEQEIHALRRFNGQDGMLALVDWQIPFNGRELRKASLPVDVYLMHEKGVAFNEYD